MIDQPLTQIGEYLLMTVSDFQFSNSIIIVIVHTDTLYNFLVDWRKEKIASLVIGKSYMYRPYFLNGRYL